MPLLISFFFFFEREILISCLPNMHGPGIDQTHDLLVQGTTLNQSSHTGQGSSWIFKNKFYGWKKISSCSSTLGSFLQVYTQWLFSPFLGASFFWCELWKKTSHAGTSSLQFPIPGHWDRASLKSGHVVEGASLWINNIDTGLLFPQPRNTLGNAFGNPREHPLQPTTSHSLKS